MAGGDISDNNEAGPTVNSRALVDFSAAAINKAGVINFLDIIPSIQDLNFVLLSA